MIDELTANGSSFNKIKVLADERGDRSVFAAREMVIDEEVLFIPLNQIITSDLCK